jgi:hypothetical protein
MAREAEKGMSGFSFKVFALAFVTTFDEARAQQRACAARSSIAQRMGMHICVPVVFCRSTIPYGAQMVPRLALAAS